MTQPPDGPDYGQTPPPAGNYGDYGTPPPPPPSDPFGASRGGPAGDDDYSVGRALSYAWAKFQANIGPILLLAVLVLIGMAVVDAVVQFALPTGDSTVTQQLISGLTAAVSFLLQTAVGALLVRAALDITEGRPLEIGSIFGRIPWGRVIVLAVIVAALVGVGIALCIIPGIVAGFLLSYATFFLLDEDLSAWGSVKASFGMVKNHVGSALVWAIVAFFVGTVGLCFCLVGYLVTYPLALIGTAYTYKRLSGHSVAA